ncbi:hypothetical protein NL676_030389 [Syzygium grande]|nr:hypothetical protein NL676_030389 [Syzygium grande]
MSSVSCYYWVCGVGRPPIEVAGPATPDRQLFGPRRLGLRSPNLDLARSEVTHPGDVDEGCRRATLNRGHGQWIRGHA